MRGASSFWGSSPLSKAAENAEMIGFRRHRGGLMGEPGLSYKGRIRADIIPDHTTGSRIRRERTFSGFNERSVFISRVFRSKTGARLTRVVSPPLLPT
jgi:hypothetical protein